MAKAWTVLYALPIGGLTMTDRRTRRAKRPLAYALLATFSATLLAACVLELALKASAHF